MLSLQDINWIIISILTGIVIWTSLVNLIWGSYSLILCYTSYIVVKIAFSYFPTYCRIEINQIDNTYFFHIESINQCIAYLSTVDEKNFNSNNWAKHIRLGICKASTLIIDSQSLWNPSYIIDLIQKSHIDKIYTPTQTIDTGVCEINLDELIVCEKKTNKCVCKVGKSKQSLQNYLASRSRTEIEKIKKGIPIVINCY
ncbi:MAG: hypothetical protein VX112_05040 [Pseudomonadota bacterium]|nr:hypothetical protein [Pseudomonadota bacterium]